MRLILTAAALAVTTPAYAETRQACAERIAATPGKRGRPASKD